MFRILPILVIWGFTPCQSYTFPVFGTKRYHRATNIGLIPSQTSSLLSNTNPIVPYYPNTISSSSSQYYDEPQPMYALPPNYQYTGGHSNTQDDTYYYPSTTRSRHEYHSYGMPTYHGEYKPSPYYYAPGPSYSYYDDREIPNNPLDDLHEEILQEDERERQQKEMYPIIGQENWYGSNSRKEDTYTKNFLRNLIAYNRQMEAQQQEQLLQRDQESEYDDYMDINPSDYEYEQINENPYDLMNRYDKPQLLRQHNVDTNDNGDFDDENVRQLKLLAKHHQNKNNNNINKNKNTNNKKLNNNKNINHYQENDYSNNQGGFANWQQQSSYDQPSSSTSRSSSSSSSFDQYMEPEYNEDEEEEEDDDWINWDRKRSDNRLGISFPNDKSIKDFSNRKPSLILDHIQKTTKKPTQATSTSSTTTTTTASTTTTLKSSDRKFSGQKEFVLPRPATPVKHMFSQPVLDIIDKGLELAGKKQQEQQQRQTLLINAHNHHHQQQTQTTKDTDDSTTTDDDTETKRSKDSSIKSNANIYDTIKELIAMEEQLEKNPLTSKLQKRFVSNEENLVHELDALKRRSL